VTKREKEKKNKEAFKVARKTSPIWLVKIVRSNDTLLVSALSQIKYNHV
jgi:hypothetical protein